MQLRFASAALLVTGCAFNNPAATDAGSNVHVDAPTDSAFDPCALAPLQLPAATLAGCASAGTMDGVRGVARFDNPVNLVLGPSGIAYVSDFDSNLLRRVGIDGTTTTIVTSQKLYRPFGMIMTTDGYLYMETDDDDLGNHSTETGTLWKVDPSTGTATVIVRDHGRPRGLAMLPDGRLATCDYVHHVLEIVDPTTGTVTPLAGVRDIYGYNNATDGTTALFAQPWDLVLNPDGDLIVVEFQNNRLRRVTLAGAVTDFAGSDAHGHVDGTLALAEFFNPKGLSIDASGAIYVSETGNHDIRKIANGMVTTLSGQVAGGYADATDPLQAEYYGLEGLDVSSDGKRIVIADGNNGDMTPNNHVRVLTVD